MAKPKGTEQAPALLGASGLENSYTYQPLRRKDSIRLLKLGPSDSGVSEQIKCEILEVQLSTQPEYEAISYTWGDPVFAASLVTQAGLINITQNLATALRYLASREKPRYLWADAVSINQEDASERSSQVAIMGEIYRQARRVLVWLGPSIERTSHVFDLFRVLSSRAKEYGVDPASIDTAQQPWDTPAKEPTERGLLDNIAVDYDFYGMDEFYTNAWFRRLWVVQEIALAREIQVYCGRHEISWKDFVTAATIQCRSVNGSTLSNLRLPHGFGAALTIFHARSIIKSAFEVNLMNYLTRLRGYQCALDLDRVYAVLNLRGPRDPDIYPDYTKSVQEVYISIAQAIVVLQVQLLAYAGVAPRLGRTSPRREICSDSDEISKVRQLCEELPSWVPDWRLSGATPCFYSSAGRNFSAATRFGQLVARNRPTDLDASQSAIAPYGAVLDVKGMIVDTVRLIEQFGSFERLDLEQIRKRVIDIKSFYDSQKGNLYTVGEDALTAFARTIIADFQLASSKKYLRKPCSRADLIDLWLRYESTPYQHWEQKSARFEPDESSQPRAALSGDGVLLYALSDLYAYRLALKEALKDRAFFITNTGWVGLAPSMVRSGDVVALIAGLRVPVMLRPVVGNCPGAYTWYLIGDCYCHGIMYGEPFESLDPAVVNGNWRRFSLA